MGGLPRDQLCEHLEEQFGVTITRKGADYISVKFPGSEKARRMRGPLYRADASYRQLGRNIVVRRRAS